MTFVFCFLFFVLVSNHLISGCVHKADTRVNCQSKDSEETVSNSISEILQDIMLLGNGWIYIDKINLSLG